MSNLNLHTAGLRPLRRTPPNSLLPYLHRWQNNDSAKNLGMLNFIFDMYSLNAQRGFPELFKDFKPEYGTPPWAKQALNEYFHWEDGMTKEDRCFLFMTFREGTKSFHFAIALNEYEALVGQYGIYHNGYLIPEQDFTIIRCKNSKEAKKRLMTISSFYNKPIVQEVFGEVKPTFEEVKRKDAKDTADMLILSNGYILEAAGIDQPIRGANVLGGRPKKILFDDPQNQNNTKTAERIEACDKEVMEESMPALVDWGSLIYLCNRVHPADTGGKILDPENKQWKKQFHTISVKIIDGKVYPGTGDLDNEVPHWKKRHTIEDIRKKRAFFEKQPKLGGLRGFLKEHYNIIKSDADYKIKFHEAEYFREHGINWLKIYNETGFEIINVNIYIGNDPALSEDKSTNTSDAVITAVAVDWRHRRFILETLGGKFDIHDRFWDESKEPALIALSPNEVANIRRRGSVEEMIRMHLRYQSDGIVVETNATNSTFFNETLDKLKKMGIKPKAMMPYKSTRNKSVANREEVLCFFESGHYHLAGVKEGAVWMPKKQQTILKAEVDAFPHTRQDRLDTLRLIEKLIQYPTKIEYHPLGFVTKQETTYKQPYEQHQEGMRTNEKEDWIIY